VSARDKLLAVLRGDDDECYCDSVNCTSPEVLVDAFAHELAEKQRKRALPAGMMRSERMQGFAEGARAAADLIDPEVSG
jgi:hypothetical protein